MLAFSPAVSKIIDSQKEVMGPLAFTLASQVEGVTFNRDCSVQIDGDAKKVLHDLVTVYAQMFGQASIEICKDAVHSITPPIAPDMLPDELK